MPQLITNFDYKSPQPNFKRDQALDHEELRVATLQDYDEGHIVYCLKDRKHYTFATKRDEFGKPIKNEKTGYFSIFSGSGSGPGEGGEDVIGEMQTVFAFKSSEEVPEKPSGWMWNIIEMCPVPPADPQGWTIDDSELEAPIWMSIGRFSLLEPEKEDWTTPIRVTGEDGRPGTDGSMLEFVYTRTYTDTVNGTPINVISPNQCWNADQDPNVNDAVPAGSWHYTDEAGKSIECYWYDNPKGVDSAVQCEWMSQRWKLPQLVTDPVTGEERLESGTWGEFTQPVLWSKYGVHGKDGDGIEYIYNLTAKYEAPELPQDILTNEAYEEWINSTEYQTDEYLPNGIWDASQVQGNDTEIGGWMDNPKGPDSAEQYEWVSVRKFNRETGKWGPFNAPSIWATWSREGFKSFVFTRTNEMPVTPVDFYDEANPLHPDTTSYDNPIPVDPEDKYKWYDGIPEGSEIVWMSSKTFIKGDEDTNRSTAWSAPVQMTDTADFDVEFCNSLEFPEDPIDRNSKNYPVNEADRDYKTNRDEDGNYIGWYDPNHIDPNTGEKFDTTKANWMATTKCKNGKWDAWSIVRIKGEKGEDGLKIKVWGTYDTIEDLEADWLGPDGKAPVWNADTDSWEFNDGKLPGNNPPEMGDAYVINVLYYDQNRNILHGTPTVDGINVFKETGAFVIWDGDSWVFVGKFTGDSAYIHIRYTNNGLVMTDPGSVPDEDIWPVPYQGARKARYIGITATNSEKAPVTAKSYAWAKFVGDDGFGFEYIYMLTKTEEAPDVPSVPTDWDEEGSAYQAFDYVPTKPEGLAEDAKWWTDDPSGVSKEWPYEWVCMRTYENNFWGKWKGNNGKATLHSVWSDAGFTSFAFTRTNTDISHMLPVGGDFDNPLPTCLDLDPSDPDVDENPDIVSVTWHDSVPADEENPYSIVWMTSAKFHLGIDGINYHPVWSNPKPMSDTADLDVDWCPYDEYTDPAVTDPGNPDSNRSIWWEHPYDGKSNDGQNDWPRGADGEYLEPTWMATRKLKNGVPDGPWVITRIKGEKGEKGDKGDKGTSVNPLGSFDFYEDLIAAWLGEDGKEPIWNPEKMNEATGELGDWDYNDGTLTRNPPEDGDAYTINWMYDENGEKVPCGDMYVYQSSAEDKWVNVGKFKGDPGLNAYVHMKFSANPLVMTNPDLVPSDDSNEGLWEEPIRIIDGVTTTAKYLGMYTDNEKMDSKHAKDYTWMKFIGEDGIGYEYVYMRTTTGDAPDTPVDYPEDSNTEWGQWRSRPEDNLPPYNRDNKSTWWTDELKGANSDYPYEWMVWRKKHTRIDGTYGWGPWIGDGQGKASLRSKWDLQEYSTICGLTIEPTVIKVDKMGNYSHESLNVGLYNKKGDIVNTLDSIPAGYKIEYKFKTKDGSNKTDFWNTGVELNGAINVADAYGVVEVGLYESYTSDDATTWNRIDYETIPVLRDEANLIADLTNDSYAITCDEFGQPINENEEAKTTFKLYYGLNEVGLTNISVAVNNSGSTDVIGSTSSNSSFEADSFKVHANVNGDITVTEFDESVPLATNLVITGTTLIDGKELSASATFTITKVRPGGRAPYLFQLVPSATIIRRDEEGNKIPREITFNLVQTVEDKTEILSALPGAPNSLFVNIFEDGIKKTTLDPGTNVSNYTLYTKEIQESIQVHLCNSELGVIHDLYIPLIADGQSAQLYYLEVSPTTVKIDQDGNYSDDTIYPQIIKVRGSQMNTIETIPEGHKLQYRIDNKGDWSDINDLESGVVIARKVDGKWEGAKTLIQVQLVQVVKDAETNETVETVINRFDVPVVTDGERGEITKAYSIKSSAGVIKVTDKGYDPAEIYATILCRSGEDVNVMENASTDYPLIAVLNLGGKKVYAKNQSKTFTAVDKLTSIDNSLVQNPYNQSIDTNIPNCVAIEYYLYKKVDDGYLLIDMESIPYLFDGKNAPVANLTNDTLSIVCDATGKPEKSFTGTTKFEFYLGTALQSLSELTAVPSVTGIYTITADKNNGVVTVEVGTSKEIPDSTDVVITGKCNISGINVSLSKTLKVNKLIIGMPGKDGKSGMIAYPAGEYVNGTVYKQELDDNGTPTASPYVYLKERDKYYVLNVKTSSNSWKDDEWLEMGHYEALYAEILVADNGTVGDAVFFRQYMYSMSGTINGEYSTNYQQFNETGNDPYSASSTCPFKPYYCVNLETGQVWMNGGATKFAPDGSGQIAKGNFRWDEYGRMYKRTKEFIEWRKVRDVIRTYLYHSGQGKWIPEDEWPQGTAKPTDSNLIDNRIQFDKGSYLDFSGQGLGTDLVSTTGVLAATISGDYSIGAPPDDEWSFQLSCRNGLKGQPKIEGDFYVRTEEGWSRAYMITLHWNSYEPIEMTWSSSANAWMVSNSTYFATSFGVYVMNPPYAPGPNDKIRYVAKMPDVPEPGILYILWEYEEDDDNDQNG